jgi:hypothetical protein
MTKTVKLSELIRRGAKKRPKAKGAYFKQVEGGIGSCAIGAAVEGAGIVRKAPGYLNLLNSDILSTLARKLGYDPFTRRVPNDGSIPGSNIFSYVTSMNDYTNMTREEIADVLEAKGL